MKLITETVQEVSYERVLDEATGSKRLYITGPFLVAEQVNKNGRWYPSHILEREVAKYTQEKIQGHCAYGELGHPEGPSVNLDRVCILGESLTRHGNTWEGKALVTSTPFGKIVEGLINDGARPGVSSRGLGTLEEDRERGCKVVQEDFSLRVAADVVSDPSAPGAFVNGVMENVDYWYDNAGALVEEHLGETRKLMKKLSRRELEEQAGPLLRSYLKKLAG